MQFILFLIALFATTVGSLAGLGGGIIIKPLLDLFDMDVLVIGTLSSLTILAMAMVSSAKHVYARRINRRVVTLALGAAFGGFFGNILLKYFAEQNPGKLSDVQSLSLAVILIFIVILMQLKKYLTPITLKNRVLIAVVGFILGAISAFLAIGGGPLNMIVLYLLFDMNAKDAAASSVFIILFAQLTKLRFLAAGLDWSHVMWMIPGGIAGGYIGAILNKRVSERTVTIVFNCVLLFMIGINLYNYGLFGGN